MEAPTGIAALFSSLSASVRTAFLRSELGDMMKEYGRVREATRLQGVLMYSPCKLELQ